VRAVSKSRAEEKLKSCRWGNVRARKNRQQAVWAFKNPS